MVNNVILQGRLTADPELKQLNEREDGSISSVCNFTLAVERPKSKADSESKTDFFSCTAWDSRARFLCDWFHKGEMVIIVGSIRNEAYLDKHDCKRTATKVTAREIHFCQNKPAVTDLSNLSELADEMAATDDLPF